MTHQLELGSSHVIKVHRNSSIIYQKQISDYLGYRECTQNEFKALKQFIFDEMYKDFLSAEELRSKVYQWMKGLKLLRPPEYNFNRKLKSLRLKALDSLYLNISNKLSEKQKAQALSLLEQQPNLFAQINYYKKSPPGPTAKKINEFISRYNELNEIGITQLDFSDITKIMFDKLEVLGRTYDVNALSQLQSNNKKLTLILCMLFSASQTLLDHILDMNDQLLLKKERLTRNSFNKDMKDANRQAKKGLKFLIKTTKLWLEHETPETVTLSDFKKTVDETKLVNAIVACEQLNNYQTSGYYSILENKYNDLRKYMPAFFSLPFEGAVGMEPIIKSIQIVRGLNQNSSDKLPNDVPMEFIPSKWRNAMVKNNQVTRRTWEMALYYEIKHHIRTGDIYLDHSKKHQYFWKTVYDDTNWKAGKSTAFKNLGFPEKFEDMLKILKKEYYDGIGLAKKSLSAETFAYINSTGELKLKKEDALEILEPVKRLKNMIQSRLPVVRIEKVLADVDAEIKFSKLFTVPEGFEQKFSIRPEVLHAAIIALGTNLGLVDMANSTEGISLETLKHVAQWCIRPEIIKEVNNLFVKKHSEHPLSGYYGDFTRSGSDGDCFSIQKSSNLASYYPKAFGYYQKVITIYTHLSDQYSVFSTQVISCGVREAGYVLDGLLNNSMIKEQHFHCTDTGGFTHQLFSLCYLLGFAYQPRLKDLADQTLYKFDKDDCYGNINSIFNGQVDMNCISEQWEQIIRIIASLKNQVAPAHLILQKLSARSGSDRVAKALLELGKLIKTIYILHYISNSELRRKVQLQLNRGESRHYLARHIFFANQGEFKTADYEEIMNIASCLSLLSNAVLLWNTPRIYKIIEELKAEGKDINDEDIKKISPLMFRHFIVHGSYDFLTE